MILHISINKCLIIFLDSNEYNLIFIIYFLRLIIYNTFISNIITFLLIFVLLVRLIRLVILLMSIILVMPIMLIMLIILEMLRSMSVVLIYCTLWVLITLWGVLWGFRRLTPSCVGELGEICPLLVEFLGCSAAKWYQSNEVDSWREFE